MRPARPGKRANRTTLHAKGGSTGARTLDSMPRPATKSLFPRARRVFSGGALWTCLALMASIAVIYAPVRHYDFVNYDDPEYVVTNPIVSEGLTSKGLSRAFTSEYASNWHPLTWISHMLDVQLFGMHAGPHHVMNVLLHMASTIFLFGALCGMTGKLGRSAVVAGLFAVHPMNVESVAWVAERKNVLSTLFWMLTMWGYLRYARQPRLGRYLAVLLLFALGLMAKPMLVTLPFVLLLLDYWPLNRVPVEAHSPGRPPLEPPQNWRPSWWKLVREKLPLFSLTIVSSVVTFLVQQRTGSVVNLSAAPFALRLENAAVSYVAYIGKMLWPVPLAVVYPYPQSLPGWKVVGSVLFLLGVSAAVIRAARRHPYLPVGWFWYLGTLVPVIGLVPVGNASLSDRYTYVPFIGLFLIVAWGIPDLLVLRSYRLAALTAAAVLAISLGAIAARGQVRYWVSSTALWQHTLAATQDNYFAHTSLGIALAKDGKVNEAIAHYREALRIQPGAAVAHNNLGNALLGQGNIDEAIAHYAEALRIRPGYAEAHNNLGTTLAGQGKLKEAIAHYTEALRIQPDYAEAHNNLGLALAGQGSTNEAIPHFAEALRLRSGYAEAHSNLGIALAAQGRNSEAIREFLEALRLAPNRADLHYNAALMLKRNGQQAEAIRHLQIALKLNPRLPQAQRELDNLTNQGAKSGP